MHTHADKEKHKESKAVANATTQRKHTGKPAFQFEDNRSEAVVQRQLHEKMSNHSPNIQRKTTQVNNTNDSVVQLVKWTKARVKRYKEWLRRRAARRWKNGKRKPSGKLVRKYVKARKLSDKKWTPKLADSQTSGHHVPPLALSNKHKGAFVYGKRGSKGEKSRKRVYFEAKLKQKRREAHWMAHEAEAMQGINRQTKFKGTDKELGDKMILAHDGLTTMDGKEIKVRKRSQLDKKKGKKQSLGTATRSIVKSKAGKSSMKIDSDSDDSEPESDFENLGSDSDDFYSSSEEDSDSSDSDSSSDD